MTSVNTSAPTPQKNHTHQGRATIRTLQLGTSWFPEKPEGVARVFYDIASYAAGADIETRGLVTGSERAALETAGRVHAFAPADLSLPRRIYRLRRAFRKILHDTSADLIASHFALYTFPLLDLIGSRPLVVHFHGPWALESKVEGSSALSVAGKRFLERSVYRRATQFIVLSQAFKNVLHENYGIPEDRIHIVPGGINSVSYETGLSRQEARAKLGWPQDRPILLSVRRLVRRQGLENLVSAVAALKPRYPAILLYIAGQGTLRPELEAQIAQAGLQDNVKLLGFVPDEVLATTYRGADMSIVPTVALEGFGLITIESLAVGTPVLVTPVGGLPEAVRGLSQDLVMSGSTVVDLVEGIGSALSGTRVLPDSHTCQRYVLEQFDHSRIMEKTRAVYDLALKGHAAAKHA